MLKRGFCNCPLEAFEAGGARNQRRSNSAKPKSKAEGFFHIYDMCFPRPSIYIYIFMTPCRTEKVDFSKKTKKTKIKTKTESPKK